MAKQIIEEIRQAEAEAERVNAQAQTTAAKTVSQAQTDADRLLQKSLDAARKKAASIIATEDNNGFKIRAKAQGENAQKAQEYIESVRSKCPAAVDYIIGQIVPE